MRAPSPLIRSLAALALGAAASAHAADTRFGAEVTFQHDDNVNRGLAGQTRSDQSLTAEGYAARGMVLGPRSGIVSRFSLRATGYREYTDLSHLAAAGRFNWRFQPDPSFTGAWLDVFGTAEVRRHADSPIRDGELLSLGAGVGKYVTDAVRLAAQAAYERRFAREGDVFALTNTRLTGTADWKLNGQATLYGSAGWIGGDQVFSYGTTGSYGPGGYPYAYNGRTDWYTASAWDTVFREGALRYTSYRAEATATVFELGLNYAITGQHALDFSVSRFDARAKNGPSYDGMTARVAYLLRFR